MKIIEVLQRVANGEIEKGTKFILGNNLYIFNGDRFKAGNFYLDGRIFLNARALNQEVELIPPKPKKYYLRLDKDDNCSYINKNVYFSYETVAIANKSEHTNYKTKFTQEEIDESIFLKFIEQHGIKEEVEDNEID